MKKQTKVLLAAAALTLGASFTAMAAETYDWKMEDGQWVCYDEDGDAYDNEWVKSAGKDYYVGDDGVLEASQWVDGFYIDSTGAKTTNAWKNILPEGVEEDDDDAEAKWFYFGSKGGITKGKKVINGVTYYFNADGEMLTGWVNYDKENNVAEEAKGYDKDETVYVNEDGSRAADMWLKSVAPGVDEEEEDDPDYFWYYIQSKGAPKRGRALDINGETYFFNTEAQMLTGWVGTADDEVFTSADAALVTYKTVYFCGSEDQGWAKKSTWINEYRSTVDEADVDEDSMYWFWADSKGKIYRASSTATDNNATEMTFAAKNTVEANEDGTTVKANAKEINGKDYIFNQNGEMLSGLVKTDAGLFYYGDAEDGSMKTGEVSLEEEKDEESYNFYFAKTKKDGYKAEGAAVTGAAAGKLYNKGILVTHDEDVDYKEIELTIDGEKVYFIIDEDGNIKTSTKEYKAKDEVTEKNYVYLDTREVKFGKTGTKKGSYAKSAKVTK